MSNESPAVGLVFGGQNGEHEVSLGSARGIADALDTAPCLIGIDRNGVWHAVDSVDELAMVSANNGVPGPRTDLLAGLDVVFPAVHGRGGEDGTIQGVLELAGIPYVGCGVLSSALALDKTISSRLLDAAGIPVIESRVVSAAAEVTHAARGMEYPLFVKPNRGGSSVAVTRVERADQLDAAVAAALAYDASALIQPLIDAHEVSVGVLERADGSVSATGPSLLHLDAADVFFSYDGKYSGGKTYLEIPAALPADQVSELQRFAIAAFRALDCSGLARVDFFVGDGGEIWLNELNTMPGIGENSHYPRLWRAAGIEYPALVRELVATGLAQQVRRALR